MVESDFGHHGGIDELVAMMALIRLGAATSVSFQWILAKKNDITTSGKTTSSTGFRGPIVPVRQPVLINRY